MLAVGFLQVLFINLRNFHSNPTSVRILSWMEAGLCSILFLYLMIWSYDFYFFICWCDGVINWFSNVEPALSVLDESYLVLVLYNSCIHCWVDLLIFYWGLLQLALFLTGFGIRIMLASYYWLGSILTPIPRLGKKK